MNGLSPKEKVALAHDYIYDQHPIGLPHLSQWQVRESLEVPTACTNGKHMTYNPEWIGQLPSNAVKAIVLHELAHVLFGHQLRRGDRDPRLWNIAADLEINGHLMPWYTDLNALDVLTDEDGVAQGVFPECGRYKMLDNNRSAEWYYNKLVEEVEGHEDYRNAREAYENQGEPFDSDEENAGENQSKDTPEDTPEDTPKAGTEEAFQQKIKDYLGDDYDKPSLGEVLDAPSLEEDRLQVEEEWKETVSQAVVLQKQQGKGFGQDVDVFESLTNKRNKDNWKAMLSDWINKRSLGGYSYKRFSRRHGYRTDVLLPNNKSKNKTSGVMILDTSGSMGRDEMDESLRVVDKICRAYRKAEVTLVQCDVRVVEDHIKTFKLHDFPIKVPERWHGRGGTDMYPAINWVAKRANQFDWCIIVSDMYWEIMWTPQDVPYTKVPTCLLYTSDAADE